MADISQLKLLINLARADGEIAKEEKKYLFNIGLANNIDTLEVEKMLQTDQTEVVSENLAEEQRFNLLFKLVQLMKVDGKLYKEEIRYCSKICSKLGYKEEALFELMLEVKSGSMEADDINKLRQKLKQYLG